ncbi:unnamed protein product [Phaedon cochleariae]|uniref:Uncharacterized protein n=1 Tax=Phaedon cochleariae TaxID=80249 RepID=A0A9P0DP22_PHACE|nr:unnamed protein product [Phaedon cochleariae]
MKFMLWLLALSGYIIVVKCSLSPLVINPGGIGGIFKGPNSETIIKGPDGSVITSESEGGEIHTGTGFQPIVVAETVDISGQADSEINAIASFGTTGTVDLFQNGDQAVLPVLGPVGGHLPVTIAPPLEPVISATAAPTLASAAPVITLNAPIEIAQQEPHIIETEIVDTPVIEPNQSSDLIGPSGRISTRGSSSIISGPASTTISEPARIAVVAPSVPIVVSSITTPLHHTPLVQVNEEIPLAVSNPLNSRAVPASDPRLPLIPITAPPINVDSTLVPSLGSSSIAHPSDSKYIDTKWGSTLAPPLLRNSPTSDGYQGNVVGISSTLVPSVLGQDWDDKVVPQIQYSTVSSIIDENQVWSSTIASPDSLGSNNNIVQPSSSFGIINNLDVDRRIVSTTPSPEQSTPSTILSSTDISIQAGSNLQQNLDQALATNRQLILNPNTIPSRNIIPPEIGPIPNGNIDLGTTIEVSSVPKAPGFAVISKSQNNQINYYNPENRFLNDRVPDDGRFQGGIPDQPLVFSRIDSVQNEVLPVDSRNDFSNEIYPQTIGGNYPLLRSTQPNAHSIYPERRYETKLGNQGVDSSQIQVANILQPPVENRSQDFPAPGERAFYDDSGTEVLWNRYGRRAKFERS